MNMPQKQRFLQRKLNAHERAKLHSEVSQIVNHRFLLTTIAVTVFAISSGWIVPHVENIRHIEEATTISVMSAVLTVIMLILYWQSHYLRKVLRTFTAYLIVVDKSQWEMDWHSFRSFHDRDAHNDTKSQILAYVCFCFIFALYPLIITAIMVNTVGAYQWFALVWGVAAAIGIILHTYRYEEHCERRFIMEWEYALSEADKDLLLSELQAKRIQEQHNLTQAEPTVSEPVETPPIVGQTQGPAKSSPLSSDPNKPTTSGIDNDKT